MQARTYYFYGIILWIIGFVLFLFTDLETATIWANNHGNQATDVFFHHYTRLAEWILIALPLLLAIIWKRWNLLFSIGTVFLLQGILVQLLKRVIFHDVPRPSVHFRGALHSISDEVWLSWQSFPSGHTAAGVLGFGCLALFSKNKWLQLSCLFAAFFIGYSRMYLGQHFLRDVLAGAAIGLFMLFLQHKIQIWYMHKFSKK